MTQIKDAQTITVQVPANGRKNIAGVGRFVRCLETTGDLRVSVNNGSRGFLDTGISYTIDPTSPDFQNIQLFNDTVSEITATIAYGYGNVEDDRLAVSNQALNVIEKRATTLNTPTNATVTDGAAAGEIVAANADRVAGHIRNVSAMGVVHLGNGTDQTIPLAPGEVYSLAGYTGAISAVNNSGIDVVVNISEYE